MGIALAIILGLTAMTLIAGGFDYLGKRTQGGSGELKKKVDELEEKVRVLEAALLEKGEEMKALETKVQFMDRLLEDRSKGRGNP